MNMNNTIRILGLVLSATSLVACAVPETSAQPSGGSSSGSSPSGGDPNALGTVTLDLTNAPSNAQCIRVTLTPQSGSPTVQLIPVTGGASTANVSLGLVPNGAFTVTGAAFTGGCGSVGATTAAAWTADPVAATVQPGQATKIALTFRPNNPVSVSANFLPNIKGIAAGGYNTVLLTDQVPSVWGYAAFNNVPAALPGGLTGITAVAAGYQHACGIRNDGTVWCWGWNIYGAVGPNVAVGSLTTSPVQVPLSGTFTMIAAGGYHTCAYRPGPANSPSQQAVFCWGYNGDGELGNGTTTSTSTPTQVSGITGISFGNEAIRSLSAGGYHTVATLGDGHFLAWGDDRFSELGDQGTTNALTPLYLFDPVQVSTSCGLYFTCSLHVDGTVGCWGGNYAGQLGDGTLLNRTIMVKPSLPATVKQIVTGDAHTCALLTTGQVYCWGANTDGQVGDLTDLTRSLPVPVSLGTDVAQAIAAGNAHNCALTTTSGVYCWGYNGYGELGDGTNVDAFAPEKITLQ
jgi:alpha-tubulin suppressor-like RCC1 family protein